MLPAPPLLAVTHADPYPYYAALAREKPLYRDDALDLWIASHPDTILAVMRAPAARVRPPSEPVPKGLCGGPAGELFGRFVRMNDSAVHTRLKGLLAAFIQEQGARACTPQWPAMPATDAAAVDHWLTAAPVHAQAAFLGLAPALQADSAAQIAAFLSALPATADASQVAAGHAAARALQTRLESFLLADDVAPALRTLRDDGARADIPVAVLAANLAGLLFQSGEAGAGLLGNTLVHAGRRGLAAAEASADAEAIVGHVIRHDPPLHNTRRFLADTLTVGGQRIEAGQTVLLVLAAAASVQPDASWTFGALGHACPGQGLARHHAASALSHLLRAGADPAALAFRFRYRPLPNARVPQFAF
ncbi:cytochrome P450 [Achromobacter sp. UMC46]|uniref:cytochrome P450 n=1 Tax=Achromobacter sp. UMC46 TaxID=1862319 RepID=UPI001600EED8|nr:cytochrome P450 [Achromobacter sp. UMC46]MBB1592440.1 cytochrome [Achromobacter sp. UMC46]